MPVVRPDALPAAPWLSHTQRSLLAEIELLAHRYGSPLQTMPIGSPEEQASILHMYERRVRGWRTGIYDGAILSPAATSFAYPGYRLNALPPALRDVDVLTLRILGTEAPLEAAVARKPGTNDQEAVQPYQMQEVMPLAKTYGGFLQGLGKHTRRNIVHARERALRGAIKFDFTPVASSVDSSRLSELAKLNMPFPTKPRRLSNIIRFLETKPRPFQAHLRQLADDYPFSITGGFIEGDLALMTYQINIRSSNRLSPSLMLRSFLVQALIERGVRHLAFVGGCGGLLYHQCTVVPAAEVLVARRTFIARTKLWACSIIADPKSRITRLTPQFIALLCAAGMPLKALLHHVCA